MNPYANEDFIAGLIGGLIIALVACFITWGTTRDSMRTKAVEHGAAKYILATPTSTEATFVWITNRVTND